MTAQTPDTLRRLNELGMESLTDAELLTLLLHDAASGDNAPRLAARILRDAGGETLGDSSLASLARGSPASLARTLSLGPMVAARLASAAELGRRMTQAPTTLPPHIGDTAAVYAWARPRLVHLRHEELWMLALDGRNHVRASRRICSGGAHGLAVTARDVLRHALLEGASGFVLVHNHPSGSPEPSELDVRFTERVAAAAAEVELPLYDHVVVASGGFATVPRE